MDCWAIIKEGTIHHEGDERSRTNPGHGYPAYSETYNSYTEYTDYSKLMKDISYYNKSNTKFRVVKIIPMEIETQITLTIKESKTEDIRRKA